MPSLIKWIDIGIDASVHDGESAIPAAAGARFEAASLSEQLGYAPGEAADEDVLAMAQWLIERVNEQLQWEDEPWFEVRAKGLSVSALMGPGTVDEASWNSVLDRFVAVCALYGNHGARSEIGQRVERAMLSWFPSSDPRQVRLRAARH